MNIHRLAFALCLPGVAVCNAGAVSASVSEPQSVRQLATLNSTGTRTPSGASPRKICRTCITYRIVHSFGHGDGQDPQGGVIEVNGLLYGTTFTSSTSTSSGGDGYLFAINPTSGAESTYGFSGAPIGDLLDAGDGEIYGTSRYSSIALFGTGNGFFFSFSTFLGFSSFTETQFPTTPYTAPAFPGAGLLNLNVGNQDNLYGTTLGGGADFYGTVFVIPPTVSETPKILHNFGVGSGNGIEPAAKLVALNGLLYGTTVYGGAYGAGTVFQINPASGAYKVLHSFNGSGNPLAGLIAVNGELYGTASTGGQYGQGFVYEISPSGTKSDLYDFKGGSDGEAPQAALFYANGQLYGTTSHGGTYKGGTLFSLSLSGVETVLHDFGSSGDGSDPSNDVIIDANGVLYGTTQSGGQFGDGTIYAVGNL
jgi:uncharacterized repeat protein (TIGR03803 family)